MDVDKFLDMVKIEGLHFIFLDLFCLSVRSMTILVKLLAPLTSSSMKVGLLLCCDVPGIAGVMSVVCENTLLDLKKSNSHFAKSLFDPVAIKECLEYFNWRILRDKLFKADRDLFMFSFWLSTFFLDADRLAPRGPAIKTLRN